MLSISDEHKEAIIKLINAIMSQSPLITNLTNRALINNKLVKLIHFFEHSINSANKSLLRRNCCLSSDALIENWLLDYYFGDAVMDSFAIEDGIEQELSTASLLILYVIYKLCDGFPHIKMYFNDNWIHLFEFNAKLDPMLRTDKLRQLSAQQIVNQTADQTVGQTVDQTVHNSTNSVNHFLNNNNNNNNSNSNSNSNNKTQNMELSLASNQTRNDDSIGVSFCGSIGNTYIDNNNEVLSLNSNDEVIVPQLLNSSQIHTNLFLENLSPKFVCIECGRSFVTKYKLSRHQFVHKPALKPLKCTWIGCERRFRARYDRNRHLLTHTGERPFLCDWPQCEKRFSRADKLKIHRNRHSKQALVV